MPYYRADSWTYYWIKLMLKAWNGATNYNSAFWKTNSRWNLSAYSKNRTNNFHDLFCKCTFVSLVFFKAGRNWSDFFSPWNVFLKLTCYIPDDIMSMTAWTRFTLNYFNSAKHFVFLKYFYYLLCPLKVICWSKSPLTLLTGQCKLLVAHWYNIQ